MKLKSVLSLALLILLSGCTSKVYYNTTKDTSYRDKAVLFLETKGHPLAGTTSLELKKINGADTEVKYSNSRIEFEPGSYQLEFGITGKGGLATAALAGMAGGSAAMNTYMYGTNRNKEAPDHREITFLPGHYYFASFEIDDQNKAIITIEAI